MSPGYFWDLFVSMVFFWGVLKGKGTCSTCKFLNVSSLVVHFGASTLRGMFSPT